MESILLCRKMRQDLAEYHKVSIYYPRRLLLVRYEDLIIKTNETLALIYSHFDEIPPASIYRHLMHLMHSEKEGDMFSQNRQNARNSLHKWIKMNSQEDLHQMTTNCRDVLEKLGYALIPS